MYKDKMGEQMKLCSSESKTLTELNRYQSLMRFWRLFFSKKMPNNAVTWQCSIVLNALVFNVFQIGWAGQWVQSSFIVSLHCFASYWKATNIKILQDLVALSSVNFSVAVSQYTYSTTQYVSRYNSHDMICDTIYETVSGYFNKWS